MKWLIKIFRTPSAIRVDQPHIFLEVVQGHLSRMKQVQGIRPFVEKELESAWILQQIAARAVEKMSLTLKDGEGQWIMMDRKLLFSGKLGAASVRVRNRRTFRFGGQHPNHQWGL